MPLKGVFDLVGLKMDDLVKLPAGSGMKADGDDLLIDATALMPPPHTEGRLQSVSIAGNFHLTLHLVGAGAPTGRLSTLPLPSARNYIYFYGVQHPVRQTHDVAGRLAAHRRRTSAQIRSTSRRRTCEKQLVAGYSRNTARKGLQVFMPDYGDIVKHDRALPAPIIK